MAQWVEINYKGEFLFLSTYRKVMSTSPSRLEAHAGFFRLSIKGEI